jgi:diguanylate cyclase (GGDEF)-like protein
VTAQAALRKNTGKLKLTSMNESTDREPTLEKGDDEPPDEALYYSPLSLDLVSALAGDRSLSESEKLTLDNLQNERGKRFFSDLLYTIAHRFFSPVVAEDLWNKILRHKYEMSSIMKRNIRIAVASLDYLSNLTAELHSATLSDEAYITDLVRLSVHDGLTGLFNHSSCFRKIDAELKRFARYNTTVSVAMMDVDNFKEINDTLGHQTGDNVLTAMAKIIKEEARESDICCRYGGDEFVVIMPLTKAADARALAERLRARIAQSTFDGRMLTASIGVASCGGTAITAQDFVKRADTALYLAKRNGKNRVEVSAQE